MLVRLADLDHRDLKEIRVNRDQLDKQALQGKLDHLEAKVHKVPLDRLELQATRVNKVHPEIEAPLEIPVPLAHKAILEPLVPLERSEESDLLDNQA